MSYLIAGLLPWSGAGLVRRTTRVLWEGTPLGIDIDELSDAMKEHERVADIHHMPVWSVDSSMTALSTHVHVSTDSLHDAQLVATDI